nr:MAG TPA: hypothetical protein [Caudoviricetes sp.]DAQ17281.1 MAG TPA: hypothetical protein [Caudoviricetes sp.]
MSILIDSKENLHKFWFSLLFLIYTPKLNKILL